MSRPPQVSHYRFPVAVAVAVAVALLAGCGDAVVDDLNDTSLGPARPAARTTIAFGISDGYTEPKACIIAMRAYSIAVAAIAGGPMTSPAA